VAARRNPDIAAVALANKNARTVWALLAHGRLSANQFSWPQGQSAILAPLTAAILTYTETNWVFA